MSAAKKVAQTIRSQWFNIADPINKHRGVNSIGIAKSYDDIPRKKTFLPPQMGLIMSGGPGYLHEHCDQRHRELGPIFRERLGTAELVFIADTDLIRTVIANEGTRPHHNVPEAWLLYNQVKGIERGIFFQVGEPWLKLRRAFNKVLLADPAKILRFSTQIRKINGDLIESWSSRRAIERTGHHYDIHDVKRALCEWSIETTGLMLFGQRMGCISTARPDSSIDSTRAGELVNSVSDMFHQTARFQLIPPKLAMKLNLRPWKDFETASDRMIKIASQFATEFIGKAKLDTSNQSVLKDIMETNELDDGEISRSMVDLIIAAADTTSNSLQWVLYCLAKYPEVQSRVRDEIEISRRQQKVGLDNSISPANPYRHAVIKEVLRLYPTAPFLARTLDRAICLHGYSIPPGTPIVFSLFTTSRKDEYFDQPLEFKPQRWLRNTCNRNSIEKNSRSAYASLPFGVGSRMCIGRRMADLEIDLLIESLVDKFEIHLPSADDGITIKLNMILGPNKPINLRLNPRFD